MKGKCFETPKIFTLDLALLKVFIGIINKCESVRLGRTVKDRRNMKRLILRKIIAQGIQNLFWLKTNQIFIMKNPFCEKKIKRHQQKRKKNKKGLE